MKNKNYKKLLCGLLLSTSIFAIGCPAAPPSSTSTDKSTTSSSSSSNSTSIISGSTCTNEAAKYFRYAVGKKWTYTMKIPAATTTTPTTGMTTKQAPTSTPTLPPGVSPELAAAYAAALQSGGTTPTTMPSIPPGTTIPPEYAALIGKTGTTTPTTSTSTTTGSTPDLSSMLTSITSGITADMTVEILELKDNKVKEKTTIVMSFMPNSPQVTETTTDICETTNTSEKGEVEKIDYTKVGEETVTVAAGTFKCGKFTATDKAGDKITLWMSEDVGYMVKEEAVTKTGTTTIELKSYTK